MTQPEQHMFAQSIFKLQLPATRNVFQVAPTLVLCAWITKVCTLMNFREYGDRNEQSTDQSWVDYRELLSDSMTGRERRSNLTFITLFTP